MVLHAKELQVKYLQLAKRYTTGICILYFWALLQLRTSYILVSEGAPLNGGVD